MNPLKHEVVNEDGKREIADLANAVLRLASEASSPDNATDGLLLAVAIIQGLLACSAVGDDEVCRRYRVLADMIRNAPEIALTSK
jgi:hypothetical protein